MSGKQEVASPTASMLGITGTTAIRPTIYYVGLGSAATPADNAIEWYAGRTTGAGTGSGTTTPQALDPGDPASTSTAASDHTAEPTYTASAIMLRLPLNQRATHSLYLEPDSGWVIPATTANGIALYPVHSSFTGVVSGTMYFQE